jgi:hypothetical protein
MISKLKIKKNTFYSLLFADDLCTYFIFKRSGSLEKIINKYLKDLESLLNRWRLKMSPAKCSYIVFSKSTRKTKKFNFKLYNQNISYNPKPTFLGITFDKRLNFKYQVENIRERCFNRLNCLKVLSQRSWRLNTKTLTNIYLALIRSILDYSSFILPTLTKTRIRKLQAIQNNAIRIIHDKDFKESTASLQEISGLPHIVSRYQTLNKKYFDSAIINSNPLIEELVGEYNSICELNPKKYQTILCDYFD